MNLRPWVGSRCCLGTAALLMTSVAACSDGRSTAGGEYYGLSIIDNCATTTIYAQVGATADEARRQLSTSAFSAVLGNPLLLNAARDGRVFLAYKVGVSPAKVEELEVSDSGVEVTLDADCVTVTVGRG